LVAWGIAPCGVDLCVIAVEPSGGEGAFLSSHFLSEAAKAGTWGPVPRPAFLRDVPPSSIRSANAPEGGGKS
jgi:hypothetical protein